MSDSGIHGTVTDTIVGACPHDCPDTCSLLVDVDRDWRAVAVRGNPQHPQTDGVLCTKVARYPERVYHPERLLTPMKRVGPKGEGRFVPIAWEQALAAISERLGAIAAREPEAILPYHYGGTMGAIQGDGVGLSLFHALGTSRLKRTICASAGTEALVQTYGANDGMRVEQFAHAKLILIWGSNPITSSIHFWRLARKAKQAGARLVCIDPRRTETAQRCDEHLALRPGTDAALAYALMHELIVNDWLDHDYIAQHTLGWEGLRERALAWSPERAGEYCGLPADRIRALARDYAHIAPAAIRLNYGMQRVHGGGNAVRAIACLPALIGAWRRPAGGLLLSASAAGALPTARIQQPELLAGRTPRWINMSQIGDALCEPASDAFGPAIEALVVYNSNPVTVAPDSTRVLQGFGREDLFTVVLEHFMTDTARYADYLLPATTQLEHWDVHGSYGHTDILLNRPAIEPVGDAMPNSWVFRQLGQRLGLTQACFRETDFDACRRLCEGVVDFAALLCDGFVSMPVPEAPFAQGGFPSASGRCEFYSARLAALGHSGWPEVLPNREPGGAGSRYPLAMLSPPARSFLNSSFANIESLRAIEGEPVLEMHADDAAARGLSDGDPVRVFNDRGVYHCRLAINGRARQGVVHGMGLWWRTDSVDGRHVNELTGQALTDLGEAATFYDCAVEVVAA